MLREIWWNKSRVKKNVIVWYVCICRHVYVSVPVCCVCVTCIYSGVHMHPSIRTCDTNREITAGFYMAREAGMTSFTKSSEMTDTGLISGFSY